MKAAPSVTFLASSKAFRFSKKSPPISAAARSVVIKSSAFPKEFAFFIGPNPANVEGGVGPPIAPVPDPVGGSTFPAVPRYPPNVGVNKSAIPAGCVKFPFAANPPSPAVGSINAAGPPLSAPVGGGAGIEGPNISVRFSENSIIGPAALPAVPGADPAIPGAPPAVPGGGAPPVIPGRVIGPNLSFLEALVINVISPISCSKSIPNAAGAPGAPGAPAAPRGPRAGMSIFPKNIISVFAKLTAEPAPPGPIGPGPPIIPPPPITIGGGINPAICPSAVNKVCPPISAMTDLPSASLDNI